jgi:hypothetical protein
VGAPRTDAGRQRWSQRAVPILALGLGYIGLSRILVRSYPFNRMSMFSEVPNVASHVATRVVATGKLTEVWSFDHWSCDEPIEFSRGRTRQGGEEIVRNYILSRVGRPERGVPIEVVRRTYRLKSNEARLETGEQVLLHCRADLRGKGW